MGASCGKVSKTNIDSYLTRVLDGGGLFGTIRIINNKKNKDVYIVLQNKTIQTQTRDEVQTLNVNDEFSLSYFEQIYNDIKIRNVLPFEAVADVIKTSRERHQRNEKK